MDAGKICCACPSIRPRPMRPWAAEKPGEVKGRLPPLRAKGRLSTTVVGHASSIRQRRLPLHPFLLLHAHDMPKARNCWYNSRFSHRVARRLRSSRAAGETV
jgi:hypothetical protein